MSAPLGHRRLSDAGLHIVQQVRKENVCPDIDGNHAARSRTVTPHETRIRRNATCTLASSTLHACPHPSKGMARNCSAGADNHGYKAGFVDLGIASHESHTKFSKNPDTVVNAFIDFLYLIDASVIVSTGSSFSFAVAEIKGYRPHLIATRESMKIVDKMYVFVPRHC